MSELYERIYALCQQNNINVGKMCNTLGISRGNLTELKMGRIKSLKSKNLTKISNFFNVSIDYLLGNEEKEQPALSKEDELQDEFFAFYGEVKPYLDERDIDDLKIFMKAKAEHKRKMQDDKG